MLTTLGGKETSEAKADVSLGPSANPQRSLKPFTSLPSVAPDPGLGPLEGRAVVTIKMVMLWLEAGRPGQGYGGKERKQGRK